MTHKYIGRHVSFSRSDPAKTARELSALGATAGAIFMKSKLKYVAPPFKDDVVKKYHESFVSHSCTDTAKHIVAHASYTLNLASDKKDSLVKSIDGLSSELQLASQLGIDVVLHPGTCEDHARGIKQIAAAIDKVYDEHKYTARVLLETMPLSKVGQSFEELAAIIGATRHKSQIGVCMDTCHMYLSGINMRHERDIDDLFEQFNKIVGSDKLRAVHFNDSALVAPARRDVHAAIGQGHIPMAALKHFIRHRATDDIPIVAETPLTGKKAREEIAMMRTWAY
jgi:apurinic endonuclease APN1